MITPKIKALFQFIEFLHSNIEQFSQYNNLVDERLKLCDELWALKRGALNEDVELRMGIIENRLDEINGLITNNVLTPIREASEYLNIFNKEDYTKDPNISYFDILEFKKQKGKDYPYLRETLQKYIDFKEKVKSIRHLPSFSYTKLNDEVINELIYVFLPDSILTDINNEEYKNFETKIIQPQQTNIEPLPPQPTTKQNNKLSDLITHQKSIEIVEGIKIQYKNIKGKRLKLLLLAFQDLELLPKERIAQKFYDSCKCEFDWDVASYNAMNGYNFNDVTDSVEFNSMKQYLETLIKTE